MERNKCEQILGIDFIRFRYVCLCVHFNMQIQFNRNAGNRISFDNAYLLTFYDGNIFRDQPEGIQSMYFIDNKSKTVINYAFVDKSSHLNFSQLNEMKYY